MANPNSFTFLYEDGLRKLVQDEADEQQRSEAWLVNRYIREGLQRDGKLPKAPKK